VKRRAAAGRHADLTWAQEGSRLANPPATGLPEIPPGGEPDGGPDRFALLRRHSQRAANSTSAVARCRNPAPGGRSMRKGSARRPTTFSRQDRPFQARPFIGLEHFPGWQFSCVKRALMTRASPSVARVCWPRRHLHHVMRHGEVSEWRHLPLLEKALSTRRMSGR